MGTEAKLDYWSFRCQGNGTEALGPGPPPGLGGDKCGPAALGIETSTPAPLQQSSQEQNQCTEPNISALGIRTPSYCSGHVVQKWPHCAAMADMRESIHT